jgi:hypothetical protein
MDKEMYVVDVQDHEDGSATIHFDLPEDAQKVFAELGLKLFLYLHAYGMTEDQLWNMIEWMGEENE